MAAAEFHLVAGLIIAKVQLEPSFRQTRQQVLVDLFHLHDRRLIALDQQGIAAGDGDPVGILQRDVLFVVDRMHQTRGLDAGHGGRSALDHLHLRAVAMQVLRHVMAAGARPHDKHLLAAPFRTFAIFTGVHHPALEAIKPRQFGLQRFPGNAVRHDQMARVQHAFGSISAAHAHGPFALGLVISRHPEIRCCSRRCIPSPRHRFPANRRSCPWADTWASSAARADRACGSA